ncbi:MAG: MFS transporter [Candidatus Melainabacteria bacterium]|nr:MFS transporter [Candidatus Melainabacteria bacterium]MBX9674956.1 MFS transporter [Candidatus Obscuribacterales bacterium]
MKSQKALDSLNMFVGDVIGGIGPYLAAYLRCQRHWDQTAIGAALSAMGIAAIVAQAPAGALIDNTRHKRLILFVAISVMAIAAVSVVYMQSFAAVMVAQVMYGVGAAVAAPAIVAVSLGIVGHACFADRIARNEAFNHFGNVLAALIAGVLGARISPDYVFYTVGAFAVGSLISVLFIANRDIDHDIARGAAASDDESGHAHLPIKTLVLFGLSVVLFHFANAALLPLAGQYLSEGSPKDAPFYISVCIIMAQLVMIPVAVLVGRLSHRFGSKSILLVGFAVLVARAFWFTMGNAPAIIISGQVLDGIGAGIIGVLSSVVVADLTRGSGHFNAVRGCVIAAQGVGAAASNVVAGALVQRYGYNAGFMTLGAIAAVGLMVCWLGLPKMKGAQTR